MDMRKEGSDPASVCLHPRTTEGHLEGPAPRCSLTEGVAPLVMKDRSRRWSRPRSLGAAAAETRGPAAAAHTACRYNAALRYSGARPRAVRRRQCMKRVAGHQPRGRRQDAVLVAARGPQTCPVSTSSRRAKVCVQPRTQTVENQSGLPAISRRNTFSDEHWQRLFKASLPVPKETSSTSLQGTFG
jgi:hypothetical protein